MDKNTRENNRLKKTSFFFLALLFFLPLILLNFKLLSDRLASPSLVLKKYIHALYKGDYPRAYRFIADKDKKYKSIKEFDRERKTNPSINHIIDESMLPLSQFKTTKMSGEKIKIEVIKKLPNPKNGQSLEIMRGVKAFISNQIKTDVRNRNILNYFKNNPLPLREVHVTYDMINEKGAWKVYFNWERVLKIKTLLESAKTHEKNQKLENALNNYREILKIDKHHQVATERIAAIVPLVSKEAYLSKIEFLKMNIKWYKDSRRRNNLGIFGEIKNKGARTIKDIKIKVTLQGEKKNIIFKEDIFPLAPESDKKQLFTPNSVIKFGYRVDNPPAHQKINISYQIIDIKFE